MPAHADHRVAVGDEVVRVRHPVLLDVRPVGVRRVRPPVVALGEEIVLPAGAVRAAGGGDGDRLFLQVAVGGLEHALAVELLHVDLRRERCGRDGDAQDECDDPGAHATFLCGR